jgi:hypothetical protein
MAGGWVKIPRDFLESDLWLERPFTKGQAWIDLRCMAEYHEKIYSYRSISFPISRGQMSVGKQTLADRWGWNKTKVIRFLDTLAKMNLIEQTAKETTTLIQIIGYDPEEDMPEASKPDQPEKKSELVELDKETKAASNMVCEYFGITEMRNVTQFIKASNFCYMLKKDHRLKNFLDQFQAFQKYKKISKDKIPSIDSFLGSPYESFNDGKWCSENWIIKLSKYDTSQPKKSGSNRYYVSSQDHTAGRL